MNLKVRLAKLEQSHIDNEIPEPAIIIWAGEDGLSLEQQLQIEEAEANNQKVIIFTVIDARLKHTNG